MKRLLPAVAILAFLILPQAAQAQIFYEQQISKVEKVFVFLLDEVKGGCLPSPNTLKVEAELVLRRAGITVTDDENDFNAHRLSIAPVGGLSESGYCIGNIDMTFGRWERLADDTAAFVVAADMDFSASRLTKNEFQSFFRSVIDEQVTSLTSEILKARTE